MTDFGPGKRKMMVIEMLNDNAIFWVLNWQLLTMILLLLQATATPCRLSC